MNKFRQVIAGSALVVTTLGSGIALESNSVEAARPEQGIFDIPSTCPSYVGAVVSVETERALRSVGFTGIDVDGEVSDVREQGSVLGAQKFMQEIGVIGSNVTICGFPGAVTLEGVKKMQNPGGVNESQITLSQSSISSTKRYPEISSNYSLDDCKNYDVWSTDTIKAVQSALGVRADGVFGNISCNAMINFQERSGIAQYGKGFLGSRTLSTLGVENPQKTSRLETTASTEIDIDRVVIDKSDNNLKAYDNGNLVSEVIISHGDDRTYVYTVNGRQYTGKAITRTGTTTVYRTEGADYASKTLGGNPGSMGYARFFNGGLAVHVGNVNSPSHGCVRVSLSNMSNLVQNGFGLGDTVTVQE